MKVLVSTNATGVEVHGKVLKRELGNLGDPFDCFLYGGKEVLNRHRYRSILKQAEEVRERKVQRMEV